MVAGIDRTTFCAPDMQKVDLEKLTVKFCVATIKNLLDLYFLVYK